MTMALCLGCGNIKFGAICPCPRCNVSSTGDLGLDLAFSDHNLDPATLREFAEVLRVIHEACEDGKLRFWAFIHYVSENHPSILRVELKPEVREAVAEVLKDLVLPSVTLRDSPRKKARDAGGREDATDGDR